MSDTKGPDGGKPDDFSGKPEDFSGKIDKLADEALAAGRKLVETDTGRKVAAATDTAFDKAEAMGREAMDSELARKALDTGMGRQAKGLVQQATESTKKAIPNELARNVAVGAAAGAVLALPIPFIGSLLGAAVGAGIGYLRTVTKNR